MSRAYKKYSTSDNLPIQVESAIRDGSGKNIENNYAKQDGYYETMKVGHAESSSSLDTNIGIDDQTPFNYQTAGGDSDITTGIQSLKKLVGGSVVFNQLVQNGNFTNTSNWSTTRGSINVSNNVCSYTITSLTGNDIESHRIETYISYISEHKYLMLYTIKSPKNCKAAITCYQAGITQSQFSINVLANEETLISRIATATVTGTNMTTYFSFDGWNPNNNFEVGDVVEFSKCMIIDLTQMFGSQVADYIYAKEQANAGDGVAIFKSMFPNDYYEYNTGTFIHSQSAKLKMVDYNQWDEENEEGYYNAQGEKTWGSDGIRSKNKNEIMSNSTYYFYAPSGFGNAYINFYDSNNTFISREYKDTSGTFTTPANAYYFTFFVWGGTYGTTYKNDICIFIYWDGSRIGYEPYQEHIYDLPNDELKGILKVVDNKLVADGDEEYPDGTKKVRYVEYTFTGNEYWSYSTGTWAGNYFQFVLPIKAKGNPQNVANAMLSNGSKVISRTDIALYTDDCFCIDYNQTDSLLQVKNASITDTTTFASYMAGKTIQYELTTPTETTSTAFAENIYVDDFGTMEFLDENNERITGIQGNEIFYKANISGFAESLYVKVDGDPEEYVTQEELATTVANINNTINAMAIENTKKFNAIDNRLLVLENIVDTVYSISFNGNSTEGTRGGRAASLAGNTLDETIANFMAEPFFARIQKVDLPAFKSDGTPLYDTDGTTQLVNKMVFFPNAYLKYENNNGVTTFTISPSARDGYVPIWKNEDGTIPDGAYVGCYNNGKCTDDVSTTFDYVGSFTGKASVVNYNRTQYMSKSNFVDVDGTKVKLNATMPLNAYNYISILGMIVLGTRNFQSVYNGISSDVYKTPTDQNSTNKTFTVADMTLAIGDKVTLYYSSGYCWCTREITNVNGTTYTYDGDAVPSITYVGYRTGCVNGLTDNINGLFGEDTTLSSGRRPFKIFGVENIYSNLWEIVGNAAIHGSASPYTELYTHQYDDYDYTSPSSEISTMTGTGVNIPTSNGYCKTLGQAGSTFITTEVGGDSSTNYCDYFYQATTSNDRAVIFGGNFFNGANDGSFYFYCDNDWLIAYWYYAVRSFLLKQ